MIRIAQKKDAEILAKIHFNELKNEFLPSLGLPFLVLLYEELAQLPGTKIFVNYIEEQIAGFAVCSLDFNKNFKNIIKNNVTSFLYILVPVMLNKPSLIVKIIQTITYPLFSKAENTKSELVVIAVASHFHRQGIGKKLIHGVEKEFIRNSIKQYKVSVNANNTKANLFYVKLGFKKISSFNLYGKNINLLIKIIS